MEIVPEGHTTQVLILELVSPGVSISQRPAFLCKISKMFNASSIVYNTAFGLKVSGRAKPLSHQPHQP